jgi:hypothetical protein
VSDDEREGESDALLHRFPADRAPRAFATEVASCAGRHSCCFWVIHCLEHIRAANMQAEIPDGLDDFCASHLLHWIEVLSLTGDLYDIQRTMPELVLMVQVRLFID